MDLPNPHLGRIIWEHKVNPLVKIVWSLRTQSAWLYQGFLPENYRSKPLSTTSYIAFLQSGKYTKVLTCEEFILHPNTEYPLPVEIPDHGF